MRIDNGKWATGKEIPDPKILPRIPGWSILVRPVGAEKITKGGILIPEDVQDDNSFLNTVGRVLVVGDLAYADDDFKGRRWVKPGDFVVYGKYVGSRIAYKGVKLLVLQDKQIEMIVDSPDDISR